MLQSCRTHAKPCIPKCSVAELYASIVERRPSSTCGIARGTQAQATWPWHTSARLPQVRRCYPAHAAPAPSNPRPLHQQGHLEIARLTVRISRRACGFGSPGSPDEGAGYGTRRRCGVGRSVQASPEPLKVPRSAECVRTACRLLAQDFLPLIQRACTAV